jgi:hypothetical protein
MLHVYSFFAIMFYFALLCIVVFYFVSLLYIQNFRESGNTKERRHFEGIEVDGWIMSIGSSENRTREYDPNL